jgi:hypothetical protein
VVVAHGGGAPEALTVILPVLVFAGFLYVERRARRRGTQAEAPAAAGDDGRSADSDDRRPAGPA